MAHFSGSGCCGYVQVIAFRSSNEPIIVWQACCRSFLSIASPVANGIFRDFIREVDGVGNIIFVLRLM